LTTLAFGAAAAPKDNAATTKIEEAINVHYLATDFAKAEAQLLGVVKACGKDGCSPNIMARAWMYVGLVRGSGKQDLAGAREAFGKAKEADGNVTLDAALATPEVQAEFDAVVGGGAAPATGATNGGGSTAAMLAAASGAVPGDCRPAPGGEIEIRRPIPVSCKAPDGVTKAVLAYKEFGGTQFVNLPMTLQDGQLRAPIPCSATKMEGALQYVVVMKDASGNTVSSVGTLEQPAQLNIVKTTTQPPPAFPGEPPPARCAEEVECPPGMPGCTPTGGGGWGDSCTPAETCKKGLYCASGTCENATTCESDSDCDSGRCSEGFCDMGGDSGSASGGGKMRKLWLGLHGAADIHWFSSAKDVCTAQSVIDGKFSCYEGTRPLYVTELPNIKGGSGQITGGPQLATVRVLLSGDYAVMPNLSLGGRLGFAFNGGPKGVDYNKTTMAPSWGKAFLPLHVEGRVTWWIKSLGQTGLHPYVAVGGGLAQVDAKIAVPVAICPSETLIYPPTATCSVAPVQKKYNAYKRLGQGFVTIAPGIVIPVSGSVGVQANVNLMYMLPVSGLVIEPSLGLVVGL
jgi:hypothetical protein